MYFLVLSQAELPKYQDGERSREREKQREREADKLSAQKHKCVACKILSVWFSLPSMPKACTNCVA